MHYDEVKYWNTRPIPTSGSEESTKLHIWFVRSEITNRTPILLDFGPGDGRIFPAYDGLVRDVVGYDITNQYHSKLIEKAKLYSFHFGLVTANKIKELPFEDFQFPVVVASEVLLHQRPGNILPVMRELARVGRKVIVISWMEKPYNEVDSTLHHKTRHVFSYDYLTICREQGWDMGIMVPYGSQVFFVYKRE